MQLAQPFIVAPPGTSYIYSVSIDPHQRWLSAASDPDTHLAIVCFMGCKELFG